MRFVEQRRDTGRSSLRARRIAEPGHAGWRGRVGGTHPVGRKRPNAWGLYDMLGNVLELTWDGFSNNYGYEELPDTPLVDPQGDPARPNRVAKGGYWSGYARGNRAATRTGTFPHDHNNHLGFRVARTIGPGVRD